MRNPALSRYVKGQHHDMSIVGWVKDVRDGGRQYLEEGTPTVIVDGVTLQPFNQNTSTMTPVGPQVTIHWLGISGPTTPIKMGAVLQDETGRRYQVQGAQRWGSYWALGLQDMGIPKS